MITTKYPNRDALYAAYTIYRDAMRRFITNCLKKNGDTPENLISKALTREPTKPTILYNEIEATEAIDIGNFRDIIIAYWKNAVSFSEEFDSNSEVRTDTEKIGRGRKRWAHPGLEDPDPGETQKLLSLISKVLSEINEPDEKRKVETIRNQLFPYDSESNLEKVREELTTLKKHKETTDERLAVVEEHCANIADTLNQLRTALEKPPESREHFTSEPNQLTEVEEPPYEESTTSHSSLESSPLQNSAEVFNTLEVGQHLRGSVESMIAEGVYVTLDKDKGFIPRSELTLKLINHPSDVVEPGQKVEVIVTNLNQQDSVKLPSLRLKSKHDEWIHRIDKKGYHEDSKIQVTITNIHDTLGAFAELEERISGLIHQSTMSSDFSQSLYEGQNIEVTISRIDRDGEKIGLRPTVG